MSLGCNHLKKVTNERFIRKGIGTLLMELDKQNKNERRSKNNRWLIGVIGAGLLTLGYFAINHCNTSYHIPFLEKESQKEERKERTNIEDSLNNLEKNYASKSNTGEEKSNSFSSRDYILIPCPSDLGAQDTTIIPGGKGSIGEDTLITEEGSDGKRDTLYDSRKDQTKEKSFNEPKKKGPKNDSKEEADQKEQTKKKPRKDQIKDRYKQKSKDSMENNERQPKDSLYKSKSPKPEEVDTAYVDTTNKDLGKNKEEIESRLEKLTEKVNSNSNDISELISNQKKISYTIDTLNKTHKEAYRQITQKINEISIEINRKIDSLSSVKEKSKESSQESDRNSEDRSFWVIYKSEYECNGQTYNFLEKELEEGEKISINTAYKTKKPSKYEEKDFNIGTCETFPLNNSYEIEKLEGDNYNVQEKKKLEPVKGVKYHFAKISSSN